MGFRFRKTFRLGKAFRVNLSKRGVGYSASIPGTGISFGVSPGRGKPRKPASGCSGCGCLVLLFAGLVAAVVLAGLSAAGGPPAVKGVSVPSLDVSGLKALATEAARKAIDPILKAPSTARYAVSGVVKLEPSAVLVQGRYRVDMTVDAQNAIGVPLRSAVTATYKGGEEGWVLLSLSYIDQDGKARVLYESSVVEMLRPEVVKYVRDDWERRKAAQAKIREGVPVGIVPRAKPRNGKKTSKRELDADARAAAGAAVEHYRAKFGLDADDCMEILGIGP